MNNSGITAEQYCAGGRRGFESDENFERMCNPDGSLKPISKTTTVSLKGNDDISITINHTHFYIGVVAFVLITLAVVVAVIVNTKKKHRK